MKVQITRIDKSLPLPVYETKGSVGFDLTVREDTLVKPKEITLIPGNIIVKTPEWYALIITPRSSTPRKKGLSFPHSIWVIDQDYCGKEDEIKIQVYNFSDKEITIKKGEKIAQGLFMKTDRLEFEETDAQNSSRGGFGSTDGISA